MVEGISELGEGVLLGERYRLAYRIELFADAVERVAGVEFEYWAAQDVASGEPVWVQFAAADGVYAGGGALAGAVAALRRINHPAVPAVLAFGEYEFELEDEMAAVGYCAIPAAAGETLAAAVLREELDQAEILAALAQVSEVLELLAEFELVHGHLSAHSVLLSATEEAGYSVVLADLPASLALETALESELTGAADIYALAWLTVLALVGPAALEAEFGTGFAVTTEIEALAEQVVRRRRVWAEENLIALGFSAELAGVLVLALGEAVGRPRAAVLTAALRAEWMLYAEGGGGEAAEVAAAAVAAAAVAGVEVAEVEIAAEAMTVAGAQAAVVAEAEAATAVALETEAEAAELVAVAAAGVAAETAVEAEAEVQDEAVIAAAAAAGVAAGVVAAPIVAVAAEEAVGVAVVGELAAGQSAAGQAAAAGAGGVAGVVGSGTAVESGTVAGSGGAAVAAGSGGVTGVGVAAGVGEAALLAEAVGVLGGTGGRPSAGGAGSTGSGAAGSGAVTEVIPRTTGASGVSGASRSRGAARASGSSAAAFPSGPVGGASGGSGTGGGQHSGGGRPRRPRPGVLLGAGVGVVIVIVLIIVFATGGSKGGGSVKASSGLSTSGATTSASAGATGSPAAAAASAGASATGTAATSTAGGGGVATVSATSGGAGSATSAASSAGSVTFPATLATVPASASQAVQQIQAATTQAQGELSSTEQAQLTQIIGTLNQEIGSGESISTGVAQLWALLHSGELSGSFNTYLEQLAGYLSASQGS